MLSIHASPAAVKQTHVQRHQKSVVRCFHCAIPSTLKPLQQPLEDRHRNKDITQSNKLVRMKTSKIVYVIIVFCVCVCHLCVTCACHLRVI